MESQWNTRCTYWHFLKCPAYLPQTKRKILNLTWIVISHLQNIYYIIPWCGTCECTCRSTLIYHQLPISRVIALNDKINTKRDKPLKPTVLLFNITINPPNETKKHDTNVTYPTNNTYLKLEGHDNRKRMEKYARIE